jgi:hypothetical protein
MHSFHSPGAGAGAGGCFAWTIAVIQSSTMAAFVPVNMKSRIPSQVTLNPGLPMPSSVLDLDIVHRFKSSARLGEASYIGEQHPH